MSRLLRSFVIVLVGVIALGTAEAAERDQRYQAVVRFPDGNTQTIEVREQDFYKARDMIRAMFCQGRDCIVEGPWRAP